MSSSFSFYLGFFIFLL